MRIKLHFSIYRTKNKYLPTNFNSIITDDIEIKRTQSIKYIGVIIDVSLNWKDHVQYVMQNCVKYFGTFNSIKHYISKKLARQLYFAFVSSRIKYGIEVYGSCSNNLLSKLQTLQNKLLKLLLRLPFRHSTNKLHQDLGILKVNDMYNYALLNFTYQCIAKACPPVLTNYFSVRDIEPSLRQHEYLNIHRYRTTFGASCVRNRAARLWNDLSHDVVSISDFNLFKKHINGLYLTKYTD